MPARVILSVTEGPIKGSKYRFDERMVCILGRAENCTLRIPDQAADGISRHHCMLDLDPPLASIQDMGSRFGTKLNGEEIGPAAANANDQLAQRRLRDGDVFHVGHLSFLVEISPGAKCQACDKDIAEADEAAALRPDGSFLCKACASPKPVEAGKPRPEAKTKRLLRCSVCGGEAQEGGPNEELLCPKCKASQDSLVTRMLSVADLEKRPSSLLGIEGFNVVKQIGRGGMGAVYLARHLATGELMALKIMLPNVAVDEKAREEFLREAQNSINLKHPNIVEAKMAGYSGGALYIALEYCPDGTLKDLLGRTNQPFDLEQACSIAFQMLDALEYAHKAPLRSVRLSDGAEGSAVGLVHRDIKPENVFLKGSLPDLTAKIADFGLAKSFNTAGMSGCTMTGDFSGTLGFIPRQQFLNFKYVKPEVDVWAAAATLYWMLTLRTPREFLKNPFASIQETSPIPLLARLPGIDPKFAKLLDSALDDSSKLRFKSAGQFKNALLECLKP